MNKKNPVPWMDPEFLYLLLTPTVQNIEIQIRVYTPQTNLSEDYLNFCSFSFFRN